MFREGGGSAEKKEKKPAEKKPGSLLEGGAGTPSPRALFGRALWSSIRVAAAAEPGCAGHGRGCGGLGAGTGARPARVPALGGVWAGAAGAAGRPRSRQSRRVPVLSFRRAFYGS